MPNLERRCSDRRAHIERRASRRALINEFVGYYGPERRMSSRRDKRLDRRQETEQQFTLQ